MEINEGGSRRDGQRSEDLGIEALPLEGIPGDATGAVIGDVIEGLIVDLAGEGAAAVSRQAW